MEKSPAGIASEAAIVYGLMQGKLGRAALTARRVARANLWAQRRWDFDNHSAIKEVRGLLQHAQEDISEQAEVTNKMLALVLISPEGITCTEVQRSLGNGSSRTQPPLREAYNDARRSGALLDVMIGEQEGMVATRELLLAVLDGTHAESVCEQARVLDPEFNVQNLWECIDPVEVGVFKDTFDRTPLRRN
jgi:hypothetical protein